MRDVARRWAPAALLTAGALFTRGLEPRGGVSLREPLGAAVPLQLVGFTGRDLILPEPDRRVAGVTAYLLRSYGSPLAPSPGQQFSLYVGFYDRQGQGQTIHSPKNCLPGAGWEPLTSRVAILMTTRGATRVNRYVLQRGTQRALVLYWYQGRGRIESNEYVVKWNLLQDAVLLGRTDEALVRVLVPISDSEEGAFAIASQVASSVIGSLEAALPERRRG